MDEVVEWEDLLGLEVKDCDVVERVSFSGEEEGRREEGGI